MGVPGKKKLKKIHKGAGRRKPPSKHSLELIPVSVPLTETEELDEAKLVGGAYGRRRYGGVVNAAAARAFREDEAVADLQRNRAVAIQAVVAPDDRVFDYEQVAAPALAPTALANAPPRLGPSSFGRSQVPDAYGREQREYARAGYESTMMKNFGHLSARERRRIQQDAEQQLRLTARARLPFVRAQYSNLNPIYAMAPPKFVPETKEYVPGDPNSRLPVYAGTQPQPPLPPQPPPSTGELERRLARLLPTPPTSGRSEGKRERKRTPEAVQRLDFEPDFLADTPPRQPVVAAAPSPQANRYLSNAELRALRESFATLDDHFQNFRSGLERKEREMFDEAFDEYKNTGSFDRIGRVLTLFQWQPDPSADEAVQTINVLNQAINDRQRENWLPEDAADANANAPGLGLDQEGELEHRLPADDAEGPGGAGFRTGRNHKHAFYELADSIARQYERKGFSRGHADRIGKAAAARAVRAKTGGLVNVNAVEALADAERKDALASRRAAAFAAMYRQPSQQFVEPLPGLNSVVAADDGLVSQVHRHEQAVESEPLLPVLPHVHEMQRLRQMQARPRLPLKEIDNLPGYLRQQMLGNVRQSSEVWRRRNQQHAVAQLRRNLAEAKAVGKRAARKELKDYKRMQRGRPHAPIRGDLARLARAVAVGRIGRGFDFNPDIDKPKLVGGAFAYNTNGPTCVSTLPDPDSARDGVWFDPHPATGPQGTGCTPYRRTNGGWGADPGPLSSPLWQFPARNGPYNRYRSTWGTPTGWATNLADAPENKEHVAVARAAQAKGGDFWHDITHAFRDNARLAGGHGNQTSRWKGGVPDALRFGELHAGSPGTVRWAASRPQYPAQLLDLRGTLPMPQGGSFNLGFNRRLSEPYQRDGQWYQMDNTGIISHEVPLGPVLRGVRPNGGSIFGKIKDAALALPGIISRGRAALNGDLGVRTDLPPAARNYLRPNDHGADLVTEMWVSREPIASAISKALDVLSLGQFSRAKAANGYDSMFHLRIYMKVRHAAATDSAGNTVFRSQWHMWERNETLVLKDLDKADFKLPDDSVQVAMRGPVTVGELWANAQAADPRIWEYDPISHNCQNFVITVLRANGLDTPELTDFVVQKADNLLPGYAQKLGRLTTDLAATFNHVLHGRGSRLVGGESEIHIGYQDCGPPAQNRPVYITPFRSPLTPGYAAPHDLGVLHGGRDRSGYAKTRLTIMPPPPSFR